MSGFVVEGLDEMTEALNMVGSVYSKEVKSFMQTEGNKLKKRTLEKAKTTVKRRTGNYEKGIKRGKYYKYGATGADSIRVYAGKPAHHGHLVEYGHDMVSHSGKDLGKHVEGYHIFKTAADDFESTYEKDSEKFADKITESLN